MKKPVIIVAIADYRTNTTAHLRELGTELDGIKEAFAQAEEVNLCEVIYFADATVEKIVAAFHKHEGEVVGFHYAGHANGYQLMLEEAADGAALAVFLGKQRNLRFVFLNGCSTRGHVEELHNNGVSAVIATSLSIEDKIARDLSIHFYQKIAEGRVLEAAFTSYQDVPAIKQVPRASLYRDLGFEIPAEDGRFPWGIYYKPGAENVRLWDLPTEAGNPLFGLPAIPELYDLPVTPFRYLQWYGRRDAEVFFGRGREIRELYQDITNPGLRPVMLLYGQSGVGKSSLLEAGLIPRLETDYEVIYLRRQPEFGLWGTLCQHFIPFMQTGNSESHSLAERRVAAGEAIVPRGDGASLRHEMEGQYLDGSMLLSIWKKRENTTGKPLIVIMDQVEEAITRANAPDELAHFVAQIRQVFPDQRDQRPKGKLVLSFRKEFLAEVSKCVRAQEAPYTEIPLDRLSRQGVMEVVNGLASNNRLEGQYSVQVEFGLADSVAEFLFNDPTSAVAPVLQVLMSRMWEDMVLDTDGKRRFSLAMFQDQKRKGLALDHFLERQLKDIAEWNAEVVQSGLVLDILYFHTTAMSTGQSRSLAEIGQRYGEKRLPLLKDILKKLCNAYLLIEFPGTSANDELVFALAHDTLAPPVRQRFETSEHVGQRASRTLNSIEIEKNEAAWIADPENFLLNDEQLRLVESGRFGMRALHPLEEKLLAESRDTLVARKRFKRRARMALWTLGALAIIGLVAAYYIQKRLTITTRATSMRYEAQVLEKEDPTKALALLKESLALHPTEATEDVLFQFQRDHLFYDSIGEIKSARITAAAIAPGNSFFAVATADSALVNAHWYALENGQLKKLQSRQVGAELENLLFAADGSRLLAGGSDRRLHFWNKNGEDWPLSQEEKEIVQYLALSRDGSRVAAVYQNALNELELVQGNTGKSRVMTLDGEVSALGFLPDGIRIMVGFQDGRLGIYHTDNEILTIVSTHKERVSALAVSPFGKYVAVAWADTSAMVWTLPDDAGFARPVMLKGLDSPAGKIIFSPDENLVLLGQQSGGARLFHTASGASCYTLRARNFQLLAGGFNDFCSEIVTVSADGVVRKWALPYPVSTGETAGDDVAFAGGDQALLLHSGVLYQAGMPYLTVADSFDYQDMTITALADMPRGSGLLLGTAEGRLWLLEPESGQQDSFPLVSDAGVEQLVVSKDGSRAISVDQSGIFTVWNVPAKNEIASFEGGDGTGAGLCFSPDGQVFATAGPDGWCKIRHTANAALIDSLKVDVEKSNYRTQAICFSPDGRYLFIGLGKMIVQWDRQTDQTTLFRPQGSAITVLAMDPQGRYLYSGDAGGALLQWDIAARRANRQWIPAPPAAAVQQVRIHPEGTRLLVTYLFNDGSRKVRAWKI